LALVPKSRRKTELKGNFMVAENVKVRRSLRQHGLFLRDHTIPSYLSKKIALMPRPFHCSMGLLFIYELMDITEYMVGPKTIGADIDS
jgi:hypothetical protein